MNGWSASVTSTVFAPRARSPSARKTCSSFIRSMSNQSDAFEPLISHWKALRRPSASRVASIVPTAPLSNSTTDSIASSTFRPGMNVFTTAESAAISPTRNLLRSIDVRREVADRARAGVLDAEAPGVEARVLGPVLEVARAEVADLAELAALDQLAGEPHGRHEAVVEAAEVLDARSGDARPDRVGLVGGAAERLLAEDVLAGLGGGDRRLGVQRVRAAVVEEADRRVGDDVAPVGRPALVAVPRRGVGDRRLVAAGDGDEPRLQRRRPGGVRARSGTRSSGPCP